MFPGQEGVREIAEELLQQARNTIDIMIEVLRIPEIETRVC